MVPDFLFVSRQLDTGHTDILVLDLNASAPHVASVEPVKREIEFSGGNAALLLGKRQTIRVKHEHRKLRTSDVHYMF
jgi:hypothetical protein